MADQLQSTRDLESHMLEKMVNQLVSKKLGSVGPEMGDFTEGLDDRQKVQAKLMMIELVQKACEKFCIKAKNRLVKGIEWE